MDKYLGLVALGCFLSLVLYSYTWALYSMGAGIFATILLVVGGASGIVWALRKIYYYG